MVRAVLRDHRVWYLASAETLVWAGLYYFFPAMLLRWEVEFGWTKTQLTLSSTLALLTTAIVAPRIGRLIDKDLGRFVLTGCAALGGVLLIALTQVETRGQFITIWIGIGLAMGGCLYEPCFAFITHMRGVSGKGAITLITLIAGLAGTVSFPLSNIIADYSGWRMSALVFAVLILCVAVPLFWLGTKRTETDLREPPPTASSAALPDALRQAMANPVFWLLVTAFATVALNQGVMVTHFLPMMDERGVSPTTALFAISMIGPMQVAGRIVMMMTERYISILTVGAVIFVLMSLAAVSLGVSAAIPLLVYPFVLLQGAGNGITSITRPIVTVTLLGRRGFGAISGAIALPFVMATAFAPSFGSVIWSWRGYDTLIIVSGLMTMFGLLCYLAAVWLARRQNPHQRDGK